MENTQPRPAAPAVAPASVSSFRPQAAPVEAPQPQFNPAHVIIVGNEKGGSGKTTTTMHLIVALLRLGFTVGSMDVDSRQRSLSRYIENRRETVARDGVPLPLPHHVVINRSQYATQEETTRDERERFARGLAQIYGSCDFVVIDTPGSDTYLSRLAHSFADTVITPINDSFVDLDVLANVDGRTLQIVRPSIYSEMVWEQKLARAKRDGKAVDWLVMRNRLSNIDARNKRFMTKVTEELARRVGFRLAPGFSERVIFREMFLQGLTVLDVMDQKTSVSVSISHVAARQEVRELLKSLNIPLVDQRIRELRTGEREEEEESAASKAPAPESPAVESASENEATAAISTPAATTAATAATAPEETTDAALPALAETRSEETASALPPQPDRVVA